MCGWLFFNSHFLIAGSVFFAMQQMLDMNSCYNFRLHIDSDEMNLCKRDHTAANAWIKSLFFATRPFAQFLFMNVKFSGFLFGLTRLAKASFIWICFRMAPLFPIDMTTNTLHKSFSSFFAMSFYWISIQRVIRLFFSIFCVVSVPFFARLSLVFSVSNEYF